MISPKCVQGTGSSDCCAFHAPTRTSDHVIKEGIVHLTQKLKDGVVTSWQVTCPFHDRCMKSRSAHLDGEGNAVRILKSWLLRGLHVADKAAKKRGLGRCYAEGNLDSEEALDEALGAISL